MSKIEYTISTKNYNEEVIEVAKCSLFVVAIVKFVLTAYNCYKDKTKSFEYIKFNRTVLG